MSEVAGDQRTRDEKERPKGPQPYIYNMYRHRSECRYAIYNMYRRRFRPTQADNTTPSLTLYDNRRNMNENPKNLDSKTIHIIWRCKTGRFASSNRPFRIAKQAVSQRQMTLIANSLNTSGLDNRINRERNMNNIYIQNGLTDGNSRR